MDIGFVGLGAMGHAMARNLVRAGHRVAVWNRTRARAEELATEGAHLASTPSEAARAGVVVTMLADDAALDAVVSGPDGIVAGLPRGGVHVSMSTVGVDTVERLARSHAELGQHLVSAPVFGRPDAASAARLFVIAAGPAEARARVEPALKAMSQRIFGVGEEPARANVVKLAGNFLITAVIEGLAEASTVAARAGVDRGQFLEIMTGTLFDTPVYRGYGTLLVEERFVPPGFALLLGLKDNRLLLQTAERLAVPLPLASLVRDRMLAAVARGYGDQDWSVFGRISAEEAGLGGASKS